LNAWELNVQNKDSGTNAENAEHTEQIHRLFEHKGSQQAGCDGLGKSKNRGGVGLYTLDTNGIKKERDYGGAKRECSVNNNQSGSDGGLQRNLNNLCGIGNNKRSNCGKYEVECGKGERFTVRLHKKRCQNTVQRVGECAQQAEKDTDWIHLNAGCNSRDQRATNNGKQKSNDLFEGEAFPKENSGQKHYKYGSCIEQNYGNGCRGFGDATIIKHAHGNTENTPDPAVIKSERRETRYNENPRPFIISRILRIKAATQMRIAVI